MNPRPASRRRGEDAPLVLAGDVGGTKVAAGMFRAEGGSLRPVHVETFAAPDFDSLERLLAAFFDRAEASPADVDSACVGVAGPVDGNATHTPNLAWEIDGDRVAAAAGLSEVRLINDLAATAEGVVALSEDQIATLQHGEPDPEGNRAVIAAGTGLGMALMPRVGGRWVPVATEGGHQDWAPRNDDEIALLRALRARYGGRVSVERVVSGPGLVAIYEHLRKAGFAAKQPELRDRLERTDPAQAISQAAKAGTDPLAARALELFVAAYGAVAGNLALVGLATGGLYVGGGIAPKILDALRAGPFLAAFRDKGRFRELVERVPVRVVLEPETALLGAARVAARGAASLL